MLLLLRLAPHAGIIHLATHGRSADDQTGRWALVVRDGTEAEGRLETGEIFDLDLEARLVLLSACRSALSRAFLAQAFLVAGADAVLASLWPVPDVTGALLMKRFYRELKEHPPARALRLARIWTRRAFPHPLYWAGFELQGRGGGR